MLAYVFILIAVAVRFMPHPMAFTPVGAALLYFGARGSRRQLWIPLALLAASDVILTTMFYRYPFSWDHFVTWAWYAGMLGLGSTIKRDSGPVRILLTALSGSVAFFVVSNFAVWAAWNMYPRTFAGLMTCYEAALRVHGGHGQLDQWAVTQNNLGVSYANLPAQEREPNLRKAIACYQAALGVHAGGDGAELRFTEPVLVA